MAGIFHGGGLAAAAKLHDIPMAEWLDLSTGINPRPPELPALEPSLWRRLPDADLAMQAREAAARFYGSGDVLPIAAAGTQPLIRQLAASLPAGTRVAILSPTYGEYAAVFGRAGLTVDEIASLDAITEAHGAVVIVNPNNPDGQRFSRADLLALALDLSDRGALLLVDEAFGDIAPELSLARYVGRYPHLVVLRSFGKFFGYAGLRLSFAIAGERYAHLLEEGLGPWPVSGPALAIATHFFSADPASIRQSIHEGFVTLSAVLNGNGLKVAGGAELFALVETAAAADLHEHLCRSAILTRKFEYHPDWLRIGLCANDAEFARLDAALKAWSGRP